jgi:hypothetical protein
MIGFFMVVINVWKSFSYSSSGNKIISNKKYPNNIYLYVVVCWVYHYLE